MKATATSSRMSRERSWLRAGGEGVSVLMAGLAQAQEKGGDEGGEGEAEPLQRVATVVFGGQRVRQHVEVAFIADRQRRIQAQHALATAAYPALRRAPAGSTRVSSQRGWRPTGCTGAKDGPSARPTTGGGASSPDTRNSPVGSTGSGKVAVAG